MKNLLLVILVIILSLTILTACDDGQENPYSKVSSQGQEFSDVFSQHIGKGKSEEDVSKIVEETLSWNLMSQEPVYLELKTSEETIIPATINADDISYIPQMTAGSTEFDISTKKDDGKTIITIISKFE